MGVIVDHYLVLGLKSGEEGCKVSMEDIKKAYKKKAFILHPDKRGDDPNAVAEFQEVQASYEILKDEKTRKDFDDSLRIRVKQQNTFFSRRRTKTTCDFEESERQYRRRKYNESKLNKRKCKKYEADEKNRAEKARIEEERINGILEEEFGGYRAMYANKMDSTIFYDFVQLRTVKFAGGKVSMGGVIDKEKMVWVWSAKVGLDYSAENLRNVFNKFGEVENVIMSCMNERSVLIVMATKEAVVAACRFVWRSFESFAGFSSSRTLNNCLCVTIWVDQS